MATEELMNKTQGAKNKSATSLSTLHKSTKGRCDSVFASIRMCVGVAGVAVRNVKAVGQLAVQETGWFDEKV